MMPVMMRFVAAPVIAELPESISRQFIGLEVPVNTLDDLVYIGGVTGTLTCYKLPRLLEESVVAEKDKLVIAAYRQGKKELGDVLCRLNCDKFLFHPSLVRVS
jgi:hypothetical protein